MSNPNPQDYINQFNENAQKMFEPWTKLNQTFLKNAEMLTEFSLNTVKSYSEMGLDSMRKVAQIDSPEAAKDFSSYQAEMLNNISQKMLADAQRMTELGSSMQDEIMQVMSSVYGQTNEQMQSTMQKTAEQATKTAQEYAANMSKMAEEMTEQATNAVKSATQSATQSGFNNAGGDNNNSSTNSNSSSNNASNNTNAGANNSNDKNSTKKP